MVLAGPTVLAFFSGGYFERPRLIATLVAWALVLLVAVAAPQPLPVSRPGRLALAGLVLIAGWTGASLAWAPLSVAATDNLVRLLLYVGAFLAAIALLRERVAARAVEPALAVGALVVIGYGLAGRLLPGVVHQAQSSRALGRLEQPITYWNAEGALAAIGLVLCARLAGTDSRPRAVRMLAAAACAPLGLGLWLSYSRGAIVAALVGLIVVLAAAPSWSQLRAAAGALLAGLTVAAASATFPGVASLEGSVAERQREGAVMLGILIAVVLVAALVQGRLEAAERRAGIRMGRLGVARPLGAAAVAAAALGLAGLVYAGLSERGDSEELSARRGASRLTAVESRRYDYWRVGLSAFAQHPLTGTGAGGFRVEWLRERPVREGAIEVHSLPLEMASELGIPGLVGLGLLVGGVGLAGKRALRSRLELAPGACGAATVWLLHVAIDWDWQVPATTLPALVIAGALVATTEANPEPRATADAAGGPRQDVHAPSSAAPA